MTDKFHNTVLRQIADGTPYMAVDVLGGPIRSLLDSFQKRARLLMWLAPRPASSAAVET
jgi:hypothetical protein